MKKQVSVVLAAAIAGGLLAGCGSTKPAETTAAAEMVQARLRQRQQPGM